MTPSDRPPQADLFESVNAAHDLRGVPDLKLQLEPGAWVLRAFALDAAPALLDAINRVAQTAALRHMTTARGLRMSVAMTNCGAAGWLSDGRGYRYAAKDPLTDQPWPAMPQVFSDLAERAASAAGFDQFAPDACLINRYEPGARLSLHQDRDEADFDAPIVSVSLGVPATFLWGGPSRVVRPRRISLQHGDVVVWGGPARLSFHGIEPLRLGHHALTGNARFNLTFRRALARS